MLWPLREQARSHRRSLFDWVVLQRFAMAVAIDQTGNAQRIGVFQRVGQERIRAILVAHRTQETLDGQAADRGATGIGGGRVGPAMHHRIADFDAGRVAVEQYPADFLFKRSLPSIRDAFSARPPSSIWPVPK